MISPGLTMSLSIVKDKLHHLVFGLLVLVLGCAAEELLPAFCGVGIPVLLSATQFQAMRRPIPAAILFAVAAGAMEESVSALPFFTGAGFFLLMVGLIRLVGLSRSVAFFIYPLYQLWLAVWAATPGGDFYLRALVAVPIGIVTMFAVPVLLDYLARKAALGEAE